MTNPTAPKTPGDAFPWPGYQPTGKPSREQRQPKRKWKRRKASLTASGAMAHNSPVVSDASGAGRGNPLTQRRIKRQAGRFFFARRFSMAAGAGQGNSWPVPLCRFSTPVPVATITAVESGLVAPFIHKGAKSMNTPETPQGEIRPNSAPVRVIDLDALPDSHLLPPADTAKTHAHTEAQARDSTELYFGAIYFDANDNRCLRGYLKDGAGTMLVQPVDVSEILQFPELAAKFPAEALDWFRLQLARKLEDEARYARP